MEWIPLAAAAVTGILSFLGTYFSNRKQTALMAYRLEQLEKKVDKHNNVVERTYELEKNTALLKERIDELEKKKVG